jgi:hypothetical protein
MEPVILVVAWCLRAPNGWRISRARRLARRLHARVRQRGRGLQRDLSQISILGVKSESRRSVIQWLTGSKIPEKATLRQNRLNT